MLGFHQRTPLFRPPSGVATEFDNGSIDITSNVISWTSNGQLTFGGTALTIERGPNEHVRITNLENTLRGFVALNNGAADNIFDTNAAHTTAGIIASFRVAGAEKANINYLGEIIAARVRSSTLADNGGTSYISFGSNEVQILLSETTVGVASVSPVRSGSAGTGIGIIGRRAAGDVEPDVLLAGLVARTAGILTDVQNNTSSRFKVAWNGISTFTDGTSSVVIDPSAAQTWTASSGTTPDRLVTSGDTLAATQDQLGTLVDDLRALGVLN